MPEQGQEQERLGQEQGALAARPSVEASTCRCVAARIRTVQRLARRANGCARFSGRPLSRRRAVTAVTPARKRQPALPAKAEGIEKSECQPRSRACMLAIRLRPREAQRWEIRARRV
jgi:hypothetical protein